jgi:hypothetical protein
MAGRLRLSRRVKKMEKNRTDPILHRRSIPVIRTGFVVASMPITVSEVFSIFFMQHWGQGRPNCTRQTPFPFSRTTTSSGLMTTTAKSSTESPSWMTRLLITAIRSSGFDDQAMAWIRKRPSVSSGVVLYASPVALRFDAVFGRSSGTVGGASTFALSFLVAVPSAVGAVSGVGSISGVEGD